MKTTTTLIFWLVCSALAGCGEPAEGATKAAGQSTDGAKAGAVVARRVPVEVVAVTRAAFVSKLTAPGRFAASRTASVTAEVPGRIIELAAREGDVVAAGKVLVRLDATMAHAQVAQADAAVAQAEAAVAAANNVLERTRKLAASGVVDKARLDQARLAHKQALAAKAVAQAGRTLATAALGKLAIKAPIAGTITRRTIEAGELATPGAPLLQIADFSQVKLIVDVPERAISAIHEGTDVGLTVPSLADRALVGNVLRVPEESDKKTRTFAVEIAVDNAAGELRAGMFGRATMQTARLADRIVIPLDAIIDEPTADLTTVTSTVFVAKDGVARRRIVKAGAMQGTEVLIDSGLKVGEQLIIVGHRRVVDGDPIRIVGDKPQPKVAAGAKKRTLKPAAKAL